MANDATVLRFQLTVAPRWPLFRLALSAVICQCLFVNWTETKVFCEKCFLNGISGGISNIMMLFWADVVFYRHFAVMALLANLAPRPALACSMLSKSEHVAFFMPTYCADMLCRLLLNTVFLRL